MVISNFYPSIGGAERQALKLAAALTQKGLEVRILTRRLKRSWKKREKLQSVDVRRFSIFQMPARKGLGPINRLLGAVQLKRIVRRHAQNADIVHGHIASPLMLYAARSAHSVGKPMICKIASGGRYMDLKVEQSKGPLGRLIVEGLIREVDGWVAVSEEIACQLRDYGIGNARIFRIPNGVEITNHCRCRKFDQSFTGKRFLYLGRLTSGKYRDLVSLLRAFRKVWERCAESELALVGGGDGELEIKLALDELGDAKRALLLPGFCDPEPWLNWADVLVQPSLVEGMSNSILEGMAHGLACIATDIPPNRELLDNGSSGILVPCFDISAMAEAMLEVALTPQRGLELGALARDRAIQYFSIDVVARKYVDLYQHFLS